MIKTLTMLFKGLVVLLLLWHCTEGQETPTDYNCPNAYPGEEFCNQNCRAEIDKSICDYPNKKGKCKNKCVMERTTLMNQLQSCGSSQPQEIMYQIARARRYFGTSKLDRDRYFGVKGNQIHDMLGLLVPVKYREILDKYETLDDGITPNPEYTFPLPGGDAMKQMAIDLLERACDGNFANGPAVDLISKIDDRTYTDIMLSFMEIKALQPRKTADCGPYKGLSQRKKDFKESFFEKKWRAILNKNNKKLNSILTDECLTSDAATNQEKLVTCALRKVLEDVKFSEIASRCGPPAGDCPAQSSLPPQGCSGPQDGPPLPP